MSDQQAESSLNGVPEMRSNDFPPHGEDYRVTNEVNLLSQPAGANMRPLAQAAQHQANPSSHARGMQHESEEAEEETSETTHVITREEQRNILFQSALREMREREQETYRLRSEAKKLVRTMDDLIQRDPSTLTNSQHLSTGSSGHVTRIPQAQQADLGDHAPQDTDGPRNRA
jgi:hypothetical protein